MLDMSNNIFLEQDKVMNMYANYNFPKFYLQSGNVLALEQSKLHREWREEFEFSSISNSSLKPLYYPNPNDLDLTKDFLIMQSEINQ